MRFFLSHLKKRHQSAGLVMNDSCIGVLITTDLHFLSFLFFPHVCAGKKGLCRWKKSVQGGILYEHDPFFAYLSLSVVEKILVQFSICECDDDTCRPVPCLMMYIEISFRTFVEFSQALKWGYLMNIPSVFP